MIKKLLIASLFACISLGSMTTAQVVDPCGYGCPKEGCPKCDKGGGPIGYKNVSPASETLKNCRKGMCLKYEDQCVPGCDPPDENNTVHGCSPCYSKKPVCVSWEEVCD